MLDRHRLRRTDAVALPPIEKRMALPLSNVESSMVTGPVVVMLNPLRVRSVVDPTLNASTNFRVTAPLVVPPMRWPLPLRRTRLPAVPTSSYAMLPDSVMSASRLTVLP